MTVQGRDFFDDLCNLEELDVALGLELVDEVFAALTNVVHAGLAGGHLGFVEFDQNGVVKVLHLLYHPIPEEAEDVGLVVVGVLNGLLIDAGHLHQASLTPKRL